MADVKISGLPAATTPLAGTEVLPIVQSSATKKVSIADVTAGRAVSASSLTATNLKTSPAAANLDISGTTIAAGGTDANVDVNINAKGTGVAYLNQRWGVNASGALVASSNNTYDIGNGASDPRDISLGRYLKVGATASVGGATPATTGAGITFPATQSASSDVNTLDDYEEGSFDPTLTTTSGSVTLDSNFNSLGYTKIGRVVVITGQLVISNASTPTGTLTLGNLPFPMANIAEYRSQTRPTIHFYGSGSGAPAPGYFSAFIAFNTNSSSGSIIATYNATFDTSIADWIDAGSDIFVNFSYITNT